MSHNINRPEPGEHRHEDQLHGEEVEHLIASGELPPATVPDRLQPDRLQTMELPQVSLSDGVEDHTPHRDDMRRTGTERDGMRPVQVGGETEDRLDHTAHDLQRETRFDPAQDNAGPQSDKNETG